MFTNQSPRIIIEHFTTTSAIAINGGKCQTMIKGKPGFRGKGFFPDSRQILINLLNNLHIDEESVLCQNFKKT